jgi:hypothetical protein
MKLAAFVSLMMLIWAGPAAMRGPVTTPTSRDESVPWHAARNFSPTVAENYFDLSAFGAVGDGVADDGPALQSALDAIGDAGGGTLFVPAGRYAIDTPVQKDFSGLAASVTILGVESTTPVPPPTAVGSVLTRGLDLVSEFVPRTGETQRAITITGLDSFLIKDVVFIGTPGVSNDALITLVLADIANATIRHCEFYGLSSLVEGGAIVLAQRSDLTFEQSVVLGSACSSGVYSSIIQNVDWKGVTVSDAVFADYGQRPELYGKMNTAPLSWVNFSNAAAPDNNSSRREVVIRRVFLDEGGFVGVSSTPDRSGPVVYPIDLFYVTGLFMNVSNFGTTGHYLDGVQRVLVESSHYGWSHNAGSGISLLGVGNAIIDNSEFVDAADHIAADSVTGKLTVINSIYSQLDSEAQTTNVLTTETSDEDPVQHVRAQFLASLGRAPDPAAHFYWSDRILQCGADPECVFEARQALATYLGGAPAARFAVSGRVTDESGVGLPGVLLTLSGSQSVTTTTDNAGQYHFSNLPTSGGYTLTAKLDHYTLNPGSLTIVTPTGDQVFDSVATFNNHGISGLITDVDGAGIAEVTVTLSGTQNATITTGVNGNYSFADLPAGGNYTVLLQKTSYAFSPPSQTFTDLGADENFNFTGTFVTYTISGVLVSVNNSRLPGITVNLSGSQSGTTTTDDTGTFYFEALPAEGNYTVAPTLTGYLFTPASHTFINLAADQYRSYQANFTTHSVSGRVTDAVSGAGLSGALVDFAGFTSGATITDVDGNYNCELPTGGSYTLTAAKTHYTFDQPTQVFTNLAANQTANFSANLNHHSITGRATTSTGAALAGATVTLSGSKSSVTATDSNGAYVFASLPGGGNYTLTLSKTSYSWSPQSLTVSDLSSNQTMNFTGTLVNHEIKGRVTEDGVGLSGVSIALSGSQSSTAFTDSAGNYSFTVPSEGSYTVTPSKVHYTFNHASRTFNNLLAPQIADFVATRNRQTISGRVISVNDAGIAGIRISLSGFQTSTAITDANGGYSFPNLPAGADYSVRPSLQYHFFTPASQSYTNLASDQQVSFIAKMNLHTISGSVVDTAGAPLPGATVALSGALGAITSTTSDGAGKFVFSSQPAGDSYSVTVSKPSHFFAPSSLSVGPLDSDQTLAFASIKRQIEFSQNSYNVVEGTATVIITVTRTGDLSEAASVSYAASNGTGTQGKDVGTILGQLDFAPDVSTRTFTIFVTDDSFVENAEQLTLTLSAPQGAELGARMSTTLTIDDNDTSTSPQPPNPLDEPQFFVRQHYRDFLNREPDAAGLAFWANQIAACGTNAACLEDRRINVSAAFFLSIEFQETGFLVHRVYQAAFAHPPSYLNEFLWDARIISQGIVVDTPGWEQLLAANKTAFLNEFVQRSNFKAQYPLSLTPAEFVSQLNAKAGSPLSADGVAAAVAEFNGAATSADTNARGRVLRKTAESETFTKRELSPAFVLMQYFGYLQRNPSDLPDTSLDGYNFWLTKLNEFGGDFHRAQMVRAFIVASEYRSRFGQ